MTRVILTALTGLVASLLALGQPSPAAAASATPGSLTGYGFDACSAPSQDVMDTWWKTSPYSAVGVYVGGSNRLCDQPELDRAWVNAQQRRGWHVLALWVGPQASCSGYADRITPDLAVAEQEGRAEAAAAIATARALGIGAGSTLYYDLEDYDTGPDDCRRSALAFLSGWTKALKASRYDSGVYSNIGAAIQSLDLADRISHGSYAMPDDIWFAWDNGRADVVTDSRVQSRRWDEHARVHQYRLDVAETHGGERLTIDRNWVDVGRGSVAPRPRQLCKGVEVDLRRYPKLTAGARGAAVRAAQCVLRKQGFLKAGITGRYDAPTAKAVTKAQRKRHLKQTGKVDRRTWTALLSRGSRPLVKVGATGSAVLRLQRALTAVLGRGVRIDGVFTQATERAVKVYQRKARVTRTGVVSPELWKRLQSGR